MALQLSYTSNFGITVLGAYAKIEAFNGNSSCFCISVDFYATADAAASDTPRIGHADYQWNTTDPQNVASMYAYLKTLPDFTGAIDV